MSLLVFIFFLSLIVLGHEFGHFLAAKKSGVTVEEFGLGYPPRIIGVYKDEGKLKFVLGPKGIKTKSTIYSLNLIPFGGFNKLLGEEKDSNEEGAFWKASFSSKVLIVSAGVLANVILAWFAFFVAYLIGRPVAYSDNQKDVLLRNSKIQIVQVQSNSPAKKAGLMIGDNILAAKVEDETNFREFKTLAGFLNFVNQNKGNTFVLKIEREGKVIYKRVESRRNPPEGQGSIGIALAIVGIKKMSPIPAFLASFKDLLTYTFLIIVMFGKLLKVLILKGKLMGDVAGPVRIAVFGSHLAKLSFGYFVSFLGILSLDLAVLNFLPFPALDGGRLLFLIIEKLRRKPIPQKVERFTNSLGFALLILLMIIITVRDIKLTF